MRVKRNGQWCTPWMTDHGLTYIPYTEKSAAKEIADAEAKGDGTILVEFDNGEQELLPFNIMPTVADLLHVGGMCNYVRMVVEEWRPGKPFGNSTWLPWVRNYNRPT